MLSLRNNYISKISSTWDLVFFKPGADLGISREGGGGFSKNF